MATNHHATGQLPIIDARGHRGFVERLIFGASEKPDQNSRWHQRVPGPQVPGLISSVTMIAGVWLACTPLLWTQSDTGWFPASWNEAIAGISLAVLGLTRLTRPIRLITATAIGGVLGSWLILAPLLLDYGLGTGSTPATINDLMVGLIVLSVTVLGYRDARAAVAKTD